MSRHSSWITRLETAWRLALVHRLAVQVAAEYGLTGEEVLAEAQALLAEARTEDARTPRTAPGAQGVRGLHWPNVYLQ